MTPVARLGWYLRRLQVMGPREVLHRLGEQLTLFRLRLQALDSGGWRPAGAAAEAWAFAAGEGPGLPALPWHFDPSSPEAAGLLAGEWPALGLPWRFTGQAECWHTAPDTGRPWPREFFGAIDYRAGNPHGDLRMAWEPARLQWLVGLGLLCRHGSEAQAERAARLLESALESFMAANPPLRGIHYVSAMECALRLIALCHALDLARNRLRQPAAIWSRALALVMQHAGFIEQRLSLYSSAGNHTVAEAAGLVYAGQLCAGFPHAARWKARGLELLCQEAPRQVLGDGGGGEQAFGYLVFVADLYGLVAALLRHQGEAPPAGIEGAFTRARGFLAPILAAMGRVPAVGDGDDGHALAPWLRLAVPENPGASAGELSFAESGYTILRSRDPAGSALLLDHGPLGLPPSFGHGHADALAILFRRGGEEVLIDPGTGTYTGDARRRRYFRATCAHNTVTVDGQDQAVQLSAFMWSHPYRAELVRLERHGAGVLALARHEAYVRSAGVVHWRGLALHDSGALLVWDQLTGPGRHQADLHWHLGLTATPSDAGWQIGNLLFLDVQGAQTVSLHAGETDPLAGWRSPVYGRFEQAQVIRASYVGNLPCEFLTRLRPLAMQPPLEQWRDDLALLRRWMG